MLPLISVEASLKDAMSEIDRAAKGIAMVVDSERRLVGTITDGDLRRAMLASVPITRPVRAILESKTASNYGKPITASAGLDRSGLLELMHHHKIRQIPLLDENDRVVSLASIDDLLPTQPVRLQAVVMAGGYGTRLMPLTEDLPKPMLPVGGRPLIERIIINLRDAGIHQVNVTTHYKSEKIRDHFGDGESFGVDMRYVNEDEPLGTAGALSLIAEPTEPLLVINGDILTDMNFTAMLDYHREQQSDMTVAVRRYEVNVPYGVVESIGGMIQRVSEKPQLSFFVNAGIYLLEPEVCRLVPRGRRFDMTDLIAALLAERRKVASFPVREYWLDIGEHDQYQQAQLDYEANGR